MNCCGAVMELFWNKVGTVLAELLWWLLRPITGKCPIRIESSIEQGTLGPRSLRVHSNKLGNTVLVPGQAAGWPQKPLFLTLDPPNYFNKCKNNPQKASKVCKSNTLEKTRAECNP